MPTPPPTPICIPLYKFPLPAIIHGQSIIPTGCKEEVLKTINNKRKSICHQVDVLPVPLSIHPSIAYINSQEVRNEVLIGGKAGTCCLLPAIPDLDDTNIIPG